VPGFAFEWVRKKGWREGVGMCVCVCMGKACTGKPSRHRLLENVCLRCVL